jgi:hypothetical protein
MLMHFQKARNVDMNSAGFVLWTTTLSEAEEMWLTLWTVSIIDHKILKRRALQWLFVHEFSLKSEVESSSARLHSFLYSYVSRSEIFRVELKLYIISIGSSRVSLEAGLRGQWQASQFKTTVLKEEKDLDHIFKWAFTIPTQFWANIRIKGA